MKKLFILSIITLMVSSLIAQSQVQWRGENRDGFYNESGLLKSWPAEGPELMWHFDDLGEGHGSVAVTENMIYVPGTLDTVTYVFAFNNDGDLKWRSEVGTEWVESWPGVRTSPLIDSGKLYLMTGYGLLVCMDAETGDHLWKIDMLKDYDGRNIQWGYCENLVMDGEKLFVTVGGVDANVIALNKNDGLLIWKSKGLGEKSAYNSPNVIEHNGVRMMVTMTASSILGLEVETGKLLWSNPQTNKWSVHPNTPIYHNGQIYCVSGYGKGGVMLKLNDEATAVEEVWRNEILDNQMGGVILLDGKLYGGGHASRTWICLDWETGAEVFTTKEIARGNSIYADNMLYFYDEKGIIALVEAKGADTKVVSKFKVPYGTKQHWAHSVINNKRLFIRHGNSLMVYNIAE